MKIRSINAPRIKGKMSKRVIGRRAPTALGVIGSVRPTVKSLLDRMQPKSDTEFFDKVAAQRKAWDEMLDKHSDPARSKDRIHPQAVARSVSDLAARDAVGRARRCRGLIDYQHGRAQRHLSASGVIAASSARRVRVHRRRHSEP